MTGLSTNCRVPLDFPRICQFLVTICLIGGFKGLWVLMQKNRLVSPLGEEIVSKSLLIVLSPLVELLSAMDFLR